MKDTGGPRAWISARQPAVLRAMRHYRGIYGRWANLVAPRRFSEKMLYKKLFDRRPMLAVWTDKLLVRDYVRDRLGTDRHLVPIIGVYDTAEQVRQLRKRCPTASS
ncbi:MAG: hypothetical protein KIT43_03600 [Bauldia sp.]|nr:hypothetical protein [Bauldia sp.]